jgi:hypothetical protein
MSKSRATVKTSPTSFLDTVAPLMKEYTAKLRSASGKLRAFRDKVLLEKETRVEQFGDNPSDNKARQTWQEKAMDFQSVYQQRCKQLRNLIPPTKKLAQHVSQMLSHGELDDLEKIELTLRLAELENAISEMEQMLNLPQPQFFW